MAHHDHDSLEEGSGPWPAFADLLAATALLFLILFAAVALPAIQRERGMASSLQQIDDAIQGVAADHSVSVRRFGDYLLVTIEGDATFPVNRSELRELRAEGREILRTFGNVLRSDSLLGRIDQIQVVGHTSSEGPDSTNWRLSAARAASVALFLIDTVHIAPCRVTALGRSRYYPVDVAMARTAREPNPQDRRIEMEIRPVIIGDRQQTERRDACVDTAL
jgi:outer membrane protein OmpA-like peptidoglycan-associated protein